MISRIYLIARNEKTITRELFNYVFKSYDLIVNIQFREYNNVTYARASRNKKREKRKKKIIAKNMGSDIKINCKNNRVLVEKINTHKSRHQLYSAKAYFKFS